MNKDMNLIKKELNLVQHHLLMARESFSIKYNDFDKDFYLQKFEDTNNAVERLMSQIETIEEEMIHDELYSY